MRFGVLLPTFDVHGLGLTPVTDAARELEALDFDAAWAGDHLACNVPVLDSTLALAAAAAVTERIGLGFSVMLVALREPAWIAKQLSTLDVLSGRRGRISLGVGVGGEHPEEHRAARTEVGTRGKRVDDTLDVLPALLRGEPVHHEGRAISVDAPAIRPAMAAPPRVLVGGRGDVALARAARAADAWLPMWLSPERVAERTARLHELAEEAGRPSPSVTLLACVHVDEDLARAREEAERHVAAQYRMPFDKVDRWTLAGPADDVAERLAAYADVGVSEVIAMPLATDPRAQYERLADVRERLRTTLSHGAPA